VAQYLFHFFLVFFNLFHFFFMMLNAG